jgi:uncharacterized membrane protein YcfT
MTSPPHATAMPAVYSRQGWVDFAKGFCIIAVVGMWVAGEMQGYVAQGKAGWLGYFVIYAKPFRMPDFFLISGLFLSRVISRPWRQYLDTKVLHYLYFLWLWSLIIVPISWWLGRDTPGSWAQALQVMVLDWMYLPHANLWFIYMLPMYFVATRVLSGLPAWAVLTGAAALAMFPLHTGFYPLDRFGVYFLYFYAGHALAQRFFGLADWAASHRGTAVAGLLAWAAFNGYAVKHEWSQSLLLSPLLGFLGISAIVVISRLLCEQRWAGAMRYLGEHSIVVYLGFYLPMITLVPALQASSLSASPSLVATLSMLACVGLPVAFAVLAKRLGLGFLYQRPAWAHLAPQRTDSPRPQASSASV